LFCYNYLVTDLGWSEEAKTPDKPHPSTNNFVTHDPTMVSESTGASNR
jgi:hypothetical protein